MSNSGSVSKSPTLCFFHAFPAICPCRQLLPPPHPRKSCWSSRIGRCHNFDGCFLFEQVRETIERFRALQLGSNSGLSLMLTIVMWQPSCNQRSWTRPFREQRSIATEAMLGAAKTLTMLMRCDQWPRSCPGSGVIAMRLWVLEAALCEAQHSLEDHCKCSS